MKKLGFLSLIVILAVLLSSCQLHTGLGKLLNGGGSSNASASTTGKKHVKATHTPPSPPTKGSSASGTPAAASAGAVTISSAGFQPNPLQIKVGATVTWTNTDSTAHTVTSDAGLFDSGPINPGGTFSFTFPQAGTFSYHSTGNAAMVGSITVAP